MIAGAFARAGLVALLLAACVPAGPRAEPPPPPVADPLPASQASTPSSPASPSPDAAAEGYGSAGDYAAPTSPPPEPSAAGPSPAASDARPAPTAAVAAAPTPTPTPDPAIWRVHGLVVDEQGRPIPDVCVAIGPHGCLQYSPRTNANGIFFFDAPQIPTVSYDLHYFTSEYQLLTMRVTPTGPTTFRVTLRKR